MTLDLRPFGPWRAVEKSEARHARLTGDGRPFVLTVLDCGSAALGFHFVNADRWYLASRPLPEPEFVGLLSIDENEEPLEIS